MAAVYDMMGEPAAFLAQGVQMVLVLRWRRC